MDMSFWGGICIAIAFLFLLFTGDRQATSTERTFFTAACFLLAALGFILIVLSNL